MDTENNTSITSNDNQKNTNNEEKIKNKNKEIKEKKDELEELRQKGIKLINKLENVDENEVSPEQRRQRWLEHYEKELSSKRGKKYSWLRPLGPIINGMEKRKLLSKIKKLLHGHIPKEKTEEKNELTKNNKNEIKKNIKLLIENIDKLKKEIEELEKEVKELQKQKDKMPEKTNENNPNKIVQQQNEKNNEINPETINQQEGEKNNANNSEIIIKQENQNKEEYVKIIEKKTGAKRKSVNGLSNESPIKKRKLEIEEDQENTRS